MLKLMRGKASVSMNDLTIEGLDAIRGLAFGKLEKLLSKH